jgi:hypothetical protein
MLQQTAAAMSVFGSYRLVARPPLLSVTFAWEADTNGCGAAGE